MSLNKSLILCLLFIFSANAQDKFSFGSDLNKPYRVFKNPSNGFFYVCNVVGGPHLKDGSANISAIWFQDFDSYKLKARVTDPISSEYPKTSINSPTSLAVLDGHILVADIDSLAVFKEEEKTRPKQVARFKVKGAKKLEDIEIIDGSIYLTDSASNAVLKITDFFDKEKREVTRVSKLPTPKGMIYDEKKNALLIVSSTENKLYELNLEDIKKSATYQIGPQETRTKNGFYDLCMGNQKEIYLVHYTYGKILVYFRDEDRPKTIPQPMKMAKPFINDLRSPTSVMYDSSLNRIIFTEYFLNKVRFQKGLKPQLTIDEIKEKIDFKID